MASEYTDTTQMYFSDLESFERAVKNTPDFIRSFAGKEYILIKNPNTVFHTSWGTGDELPVNGIIFEYFDLIINNTPELKELRLPNLFVKELPLEITQLKKLTTLEICFVRSADVEQNIKIFKSMPALKFLDLNGSRLSESQRDHIRTELKKNGIVVNDIVMLRSK